MLVSKKNAKANVWALLAMVLSVLVIANDFTAFSVALPMMNEQLHTGIDKTQWVINGYTLMFGVFIVTGGRLADRIGRRKTLIFGLVIFAFFSVLAGLVNSIYGVIICRILMGIGGALIWPSVIGIVFSVFPVSKAGIAGALVLGTAGFGNAMGPLLGGGLTDTWGWRWIFFINLPIAIIVYLLVCINIENDNPVDQKESIDYVGVSTLSISLLSLLLVLDLGISVGWKNPFILSLFVIFLVALFCFVLIERRGGESALIPPDIIHNVSFLLAGLATLMTSAVFFTVLVYLPLFFTKVMQYSAMESGIGLLPIMLTFALSSFFAGAFYEKLGAKWITSIGTGSLVLGMFLLSHLTMYTSYTSMLTGMIVLGLGVGFFYSTITTVALTSVSETRASLAGGIIYMLLNVGGAIGLAVNTVIVAQYESLSEGMNMAFSLNAILSFLGLLICLLWIGNKSNIEKS
ncbi:MFS transporter [uncultured Shewanella sp.]|uniref:MFS transporter n=1 Tax=uncultured Shewanella sp. TaxID=173975 RepID=UPI00263A3491|nr:MFS transporter [uncultured Shewanella sp.]